MKDEFEKKKLGLNEILTRNLSGERERRNAEKISELSVSWQNSRCPGRTLGVLAELLTEQFRR
jgi:hypothetical protein